MYCFWADHLQYWFKCTSDHDKANSMFHKQSARNLKFFWHTGISNVSPYRYTQVTLLLVLLLMKSSHSSSCAINLLHFFLLFHFTTHPLKPFLARQLLTLTLVPGDSARCQESISLDLFQSLKEMTFKTQTVCWTFRCIFLPTTCPVYFIRLDSLNASQKASLVGSYSLTISLLKPNYNDVC